MRSFEHVNAASVAGAVRLLAPRNHSRPIAGGTDLMTQMRLGIVSPDRIVNLKTIPDLDYIICDDSGLDIGALATLDAVASHAMVRENYPLLTKAIGVAASPQLRNMGTIGGNLLQASRCWYYRGQFPCWLKQGDVCYAREGENSHHAIFGDGPCCMVHPSDLAPALIALGAEVNTVGPRGERTLALEDMYQSPREDSRQLTVLDTAEIITGIHVPPPPLGSRGIYLKAMERRVWAFALASVAVQAVVEGDMIRESRVVLGGVAPRPWRLPQTEALLQGQPIIPAAIGQAAEIAVMDARPLSHNRYKLALVRGIITEALSAIGEGSAQAPAKG